MSLITFITTAWLSFVQEVLGIGNATKWGIAIFMMLALSPVVFVRDIKKFNWTFLVGNLCIVLTVLIVSGVMIDKNINRLHPPTGVVWFNQ